MRKSNALVFLVVAVAFLLGAIAFQAFMEWVVPPAQSQVAGTFTVDGKVFIVLSTDDAAALINKIDELRATVAKQYEMLQKGGCV